MPGGMGAFKDPPARFGLGLGYLTLTWTDTRLWEKLSQRQEEVRLPNCSSKFGVKVVARLKRVVAKERECRWIMI